MTLPASGAISLGGLKGEFGGNASPKLSDYYKNGAFNKNTLSTVPSSGTIALSKFYGASKIQNTVFRSSGDVITYRGVEGDKIVFPNGSIQTVTNTQPISISGSSNAGIFTIIHSQTASTNLPVLAGPGLTEIHSITNLPQVIGLSGFEAYPDSTEWVGFKIYTRPNLTVVPNILPKNITTLANMFSGAWYFNQNISGWDVSNVTNMSNMFSGAWSFNQPIGNWDVSNVTNMYNVFGFATSFNQPIGNWNVSNVTNMASMFNSASAFNQYLGNWCVSKITSEPSNFAKDAPKFLASNKPRWGTCSRGY